MVEVSDALANLGSSAAGTATTTLPSRGGRLVALCVLVGGIGQRPAIDAAQGQNDEVFAEHRRLRRRLDVGAEAS